MQLRQTVLLCAPRTKTPPRSRMVALSTQRNRPRPTPTGNAPASMTQPSLRATLVSSRTNSRFWSRRTPRSRTTAYRSLPRAHGSTSASTPRSTRGLACGRYEATADVWVARFTAATVNSFHATSLVVSRQYQHLILWLRPAARGASSTAPATLRSADNGN